MSLAWAIALICVAYLIGRAVGKDLGRTQALNALPLRMVIDVNGDRVAGELVISDLRPEHIAPNTEEEPPHDRDR